MPKRFEPACSCAATGRRDAHLRPLDVGVARQRLLTAGAAALATVAAALPGGALAQELHAQETHADWVSVVAYDLDEVRYRAGTLFAELDGVVYLIFDRLAGDCEKQSISMNILLPKPASVSTRWENNVGAVRVDSHPVRRITYNMSTQAGLPVIFVSIDHVEPTAGFLSELRSGRYARFKMETDRTTYYLRFSLQGYSAATDRTLALCNRTSGLDFRDVPRKLPDEQRPDRDYFDNQPE